jgi:8-oxo-dGTP pyrophosphatase MutT (NUDIX family)
MADSEAGQIYKIYVNDSLLTLATEKVTKEDLPEYEDSLLMRYRHNQKLLLNVLDNLEKSQKPRQIILTTDNLKLLFTETIALFRWAEAGGGVVQNIDDEILAIFRRGRWDLPKGKLDPGETFEQAAVREVIEETGITAVKRFDLITTSMHAFRTRGNTRAIKVTKWFHMTSQYKDLTVQTEEDIEKAIWIKPQDFLNGDYDMFASIRYVVEQYLDHLSVNVRE